MEMQAGKENCKIYHKYFKGILGYYHGFSQIRQYSAYTQGKIIRKLENSLFALTISILTNRMWK